MLQKLFKKTITVISILFLSFHGQSYSLFNSTHIPKEMFESILNDLPASKAIPVTGEEWTEEPLKLRRAFGGWAVSKELFDFIRSILPEGNTLLELGSGWGSGQFSNYYTVYSVEHDKRWLGKYNTNYIYAPIKGKWYDIAVLQAKLPTTYDLILVDGPPGYIGRYGFYTHLDLFNTNLPIIFDDVHRKDEYKVMIQVGQKLQRDAIVFNLGPKKKKFGIIFYENNSVQDFLFSSFTIYHP